MSYDVKELLHSKIPFLVKGFEQKTKLLETSILQAELCLENTYFNVRINLCQRQIGWI